MRSILVAALAVGFLSLASGAVDLNNLEDMDVEALFQDKTRSAAVFQCLMDQGPCGEMQPLRDSLPSMVETQCANCSPKQREKYVQVNLLLLSKYPREYEALALKYSPKLD